MRCNGFKDVYGRTKWDDVSPTITSGCFNPSKGRFLHPDQDQAITMREAALLQGFPRRYVFNSTSKVSVASMIGNAFPPPFCTAMSKKVPSSFLIMSGRPAAAAITSAPPTRARLLPLVESSCFFTVPPKLLRRLRCVKYIKAAPVATPPGRVCRSSTALMR